MYIRDCWFGLTWMGLSVAVQQRFERFIVYWQVDCCQDLVVNFSQFTGWYIQFFSSVNNSTNQ